jgi:hypothetical protein
MSTYSAAAEPADSDHDTQFTAGLLFDVADAHVPPRLPKPQAVDGPHLMTAIYQFIYKERT